MFKLFDRVLDKATGKTCFIIDIDDGDQGPVYALEAEDQGDEEWFRLAEESEIEKVPERGYDYGR